MFTEKQIKKFNARIMRDPNSGCHLWTATCNKKGYGIFSLNGKGHRAHRISWEINGGIIPSGSLVLHKCDTPACVNPSHLFIGSNADNMADKIAKGRGRVPFGSSHWKSKLTEKEAIEIYSDDRSAIEIAADYGVGKRTIFRIKAKEGWRHI